MADIGDVFMVDRPETEDVLTAPVDGPALGQADAAEDTQQGGLAMKRKHYTTEQIIAILKENEP